MSCDCHVTCIRLTCTDPSVLQTDLSATHLNSQVYAFIHYLQVPVCVCMCVCVCVCVCVCMCVCVYCVERSATATRSTGLSPSLLPLQTAQAQMGLPAGAGKKGKGKSGSGSSVRGRHGTTPTTLASAGLEQHSFYVFCSAPPCPTLLRVTV